MPDLANPDNRRALRNILQGIALLVLLWFVYDIIQKLSSLNDAASLKTIGVDCLIVIGLGTFLDKSENVTRAIKFKAGDVIDAEIGADDTKADS